MNATPDTHSKTIGYLLWLFGFTGAHRFYYGKPVSGTIWFFTFGLFLLGWIVDLFLIPSMDRAADRRFVAGPINYSVAWILLTFLGVFGMHRFYQGKWGWGLLYLVTLGLFGIVYGLTRTPVHGWSDPVTLLSLGAGVVMEIEGEGDDAKLTIFFERAGKKRLIARYAALEPA